MYSVDTELFLVKYPHVEKECIMSKKEIQSIFNFSANNFDTLKVRKLVIIRQELIDNKEIASKRFLKERGL